MPGDQKANWGEREDHYGGEQKKGGERRMGGEG